MELDKTLSEEEYALIQKSRSEIDLLIRRLGKAFDELDRTKVIETAADISLIFFAIGREAGKQEANAGG